MIGQQRAIVRDVPGITRDSLDARVRVGSRTVRVTDTAGILKYGFRPAPCGSAAAASELSRIGSAAKTAEKTRGCSIRQPRQRPQFGERTEEENELDSFTMLRTQRAMQDAEAVVVVVDAQSALFSSRDAQIAREAVRRGRSVVVCLNKMDELGRLRGLRDVAVDIFSRHGYSSGGDVGCSWLGRGRT